jgi:hypothetical protein
MNKQIEHLFNEAGFHKPEMERLGIEHKFEKFAELIVLKCCDIADEIERADMDSYASKYIKAHFGVGE